jgi:hypothetical protein
MNDAFDKGTSGPSVLWLFPGFLDRPSSVYSPGGNTLRGRAAPDAPPQILVYSGAEK